MHTGTPPNTRRHMRVNARPRPGGSARAGWTRSTVAPSLSWCPSCFEALILPSGSGLIAGLGCASSGRAVVADADPGEDAFLGEAKGARAGQGRLFFVEHRPQYSILAP